MVFYCIGFCKRGYVLLVVGGFFLGVFWLVVCLNFLEDIYKFGNDLGF